MYVEKKTSDELWLRISWDEKAWIQNALNEARECVDPTEMHARMGAFPEELDGLLRQFSEILK